jgi:hypothetical protein
MALENLISISFSPEDNAKINEYLSGLENIYKDKLIALMASQRQEYGRLGPFNTPWVRAVARNMDLKPDLIPGFIDKTEYDIDMKAFDALQPVLNRLEALRSGIDDTLILVGNDLYNNSLSYYRNLKLLARQNVPGAKPIFDELSLHFPGAGKKGSAAKPE